MQSARSRLLGDLIEGLPDDQGVIALLQFLLEQPGSTPIVHLPKALHLEPRECARLLDRAAQEGLVEIDTGGDGGHVAKITAFGRQVIQKSVLV